MTDSDDERRVLVTPADLVGYEIDGRYRLDSILGGGGMGVVFRTTQRNLNREVAIKLLKLEDRGTRRLERFRREIDIIAQLTHPNIVRVFDSGEDPGLGLHYIAMELVDGAPLDELMTGHRLTPELAVDIAYEVCAALTEPHRTGIVHRDIKPANVLLATRSDDTLSVKVVDFGIARTISGTDSPNGKITTTGVVVGSPMYMAPEVARGESLDGRTDLYSLGVLLYEMITGDTPFRGATPVAIMLRQAVDEPPSLAESVGDDFAVPELIALVDQMLSKERRDRPSDAKDVLRELDAIRQTHGFGRVRLDSDVPLIEALDHHRIRVSLHVDDSLEESVGAGPFDATTTMTSQPEATHSDSFSGWLVTERARASIADTQLSSAVRPRTTAPERDVAPASPEPSDRSSFPWLLVAVGAIAVIGIVAAMLLNGSQPKAGAVVEIGADASDSSGVTSGVAERPAGSAARVATQEPEPADPMVFDAADVGVAPDASADPVVEAKSPDGDDKHGPKTEPAAKEVGELTGKKRRETGESETDKQVDEAMKWLKR